MQLANKTVYMGCDHAGFELKDSLKQYLAEKGIKVEDLGCYTTDRVDYPDYAAKVCNEVQKSGDDAVGLVVCGSGIGISMAANKFKGIRCINCNDIYSALQGRKNDNCNVLSLGCRVIGPEIAKQIVDTFLETPFDKSNQEAYARRLEKLKEIEEQNLKN